MVNWEKRLYDRYVSTGQANRPKDIAALHNPYYDEIIREHVPKDKSAAILDLACGHGRLVHHLKQHGYSDVLGIDLSDEQIAVAHELGIPEVICQDIREFLTNSNELAYDVIFLMDILEHLEKQQLFDVLDGANRLLKNNGRIIIHVPNGAGIFGMRVRYGDVTHVSAFTNQSLDQILRVCGFSNVLFYEDKPIAHGFISFIRRIVWQVLTLPFRILLAAETGTFGHVLSQNLLAVATKAV